MKKVFLSVIYLLLVIVLRAQSTYEKLQNAYQQFENDSQLKHAISSLYVTDAKTGKIIFDKNSLTGLAPASTQKIITTVTAFELLGKNYRYKTQLGIDGNIEKGKLKGNLFIIGSGDPTLGSFRWKETKDSAILKKWIDAIRINKIKEMDGNLISDDTRFETQLIPDGWIWQDIGNYYGAGSSGINWKENQFEIVLSSGKKIGDPVKIVRSDMDSDDFIFIKNELASAKKGSGDNAYIYLPAYSSKMFIRGTIPIDESRFSISGAITDPAKFLIRQLSGQLIAANPKFFTTWKSSSDWGGLTEKAGNRTKTISTHFSPPLDSIIYWLNKKSINLYAETLVKTFAYEKQGLGRTDSGLAILKDFWKQKGIDPDELNIYDGSGLSPLNRVTTHAQVEVLKYAKNQTWFSSFYYSLPEYNNMKMKSGTISNVKGFCGYHTSSNGSEFIFSFLVNNYNGSASSLVQKMYRVLNELK